MTSAAQRSDNAGDLTMRAELRSLLCSDVPDPRSYQPGGTFCVWFQALVGPKYEPGEESFQFCVCSPSWLEAELAQQGIIRGRFMLITAEYSYDVVERYVRERMLEATGHDWHEIALKLSRWAYWEFEDYTDLISK